MAEKQNGPTFEYVVYEDTSVSKSSFFIYMNVLYISFVQIVLTCFTNHTGPVPEGICQSFKEA